MKETIMVLILYLLAVIPVHAGTVAMSGLWSFEGEMNTTDFNGGGVFTEPLIDEFDFNTGLVNLTFDSPFFGPETWYATGTIEEHLNATYFGSLEIFRNTSSYNWNILWDITQQGDTANVVTLDGDGNAVPGLSMTEGPWISFSHAVDGRLTTVPVPAAIWLFGSGLIGLIGFFRCKKAK